MITADDFVITPQILELVSLAYQKNEINKRRRRCYRLMTEDESEHWRKLGEIGYEQRKKQMKKFTPRMRKLRKEAGVNLMWDDSGNIKAITAEQEESYWNLQTGVHTVILVQKAVIPKRHFKRLHEQYVAEKILLED